MNRPPPITLTDAAVERIKFLVSQSDKPVLGLRIGVKASGCSGYSYTMDYAETVDPLDEVVEVDGLKVFVEGSAIMYLVGTELDFTTDAMGSASFAFKNPNETDRCGCGESFTV